MKTLRVWLMVGLAFVTVVATACTSSAPTATPTLSVPTASPTASTTATPSATTMGQQAQAGQTIFASRCAKCHGQQGEGVTAPAVIGSGANLGKYGTAQSLLNFIDVAMPLDSPGSLSADQYQQVLCYLLVQNNDVTAGTQFSAGQLGSIALK